MGSISIKELEKYYSEFQQTKLQFYANLSGKYYNKLFTFKIKSFNDVVRILKLFKSKGNKIKVAYVTEYHPQTGEINNDKIDKVIINSL